MPDIATVLRMGYFLMIKLREDLAYHLGDGIGSIKLVAAHDLKCPIARISASGLIGHCVKAYQLMCHRNGEQRFDHFTPISDRLIVEISPLEVELAAKGTIRTGIGKVQGLIRCHRDKNLNQGKEISPKQVFARVALDLVARLTYGYAAPFKLDVNHGHAVDE